LPAKLTLTGTDVTGNDNKLVNVIIGNSLNNVLDGWAGAGLDKDTSLGRRKTIWTGSISAAF